MGSHKHWYLVTSGKVEGLESDVCRRHVSNFFRAGIRTTKNLLHLCVAMRDREETRIASIKDGSRDLLISITFILHLLYLTRRSVGNQKRPAFEFGNAL
jgi:hypothetical protein